MSETLKEKYERTKYWYDVAKELLEGRKIEHVWWQEWDDEYPEEGTGLVFLTDNDDIFFVGRDDEGNGPGALHVVTNPDNVENRTAGSKNYPNVLPVGVESGREYSKMKLKMAWDEENKDD